MENIKNDSFGSFSSFSINNFKIFKSSEINDEDIPCDHHLYMILGFPKIFIREITENKEGLLIRVETEELIPIELTFNDGSENYTFKKRFDNTSVEINGEHFSILELIFEYIYSDRKSSIISEVLYIGQAQGTDGLTNVKNRLLSHSTLQKILSDCHDSKINYDVRIISFSVKEDRIATTLTTEQTSKIQIDDVLVGESFTEKSVIINIVEAGLINLLKPKYNKNFKNSSFPSRNHKSYENYNKNSNLIIIDLRKLPSFIFCQPNNVIINASEDILCCWINETEFVELN